MCQPNQSSWQVTSSWLKNELYELTEAGREILESKDGWLNDNLMDAGRQLIFNALGSLSIGIKLSEKGVGILPSFWRPYSVIVRWYLSAAVSIYFERQHS